MSVLLYAGGWLLLGLILCRIAYYAGAYTDHDYPVDDGYAIFITLAIVAIAPILAPLAAATTVIGGAGYGLYWLVTLPTRAERRARRRASREQEREHIRAEARRLGLPLLEDET